MVQTQVTAQGCLGSTPEGRRPQIRGCGAGGSLAVSSPTPATPLLSPAKIRELNHAAFASLSYPTDRQVLRNPHVGRPGFLVSMSIHPRTAARPGRHAGLVLTPNCQSRSARSQKRHPKLTYTISTNNIHSLRQCHAMLWPRTFVRGNEIFGRTERPAPLVSHGRARHFPAPGKREWPLSPYGRSIAHLPRIFQDIGARPI